MAVILLCFSPVAFHVVLIATLPITWDAIALIKVNHAVFSCNMLGHVRANCPDLAAQSMATTVALAIVENHESALTSSPPIP